MNRIGNQSLTASKYPADQLECNQEDVNPQSDPGDTKSRLQILLWMCGCVGKIGGHGQPGFILSPRLTDEV